VSFANPEVSGSQRFTWVGAVRDRHGKRETQGRTLTWNVVGRSGDIGGLRFKDERGQAVALGKAGTSQIDLDLFART
jgi:hypothetical protein